MWLEDLYETIVLETTGNRITLLVTNPGRILLTSSRIYFQPYNNAEPWPVVKIRLSDIERAIKRRFLLRHVGIELYCSNNSPIKHFFLTLRSPAERDHLYSKLLEQPALELEDFNTDNITLLWQNGIISNYDYLLYINSLADRSFNDLTQYPVFPWVLSDYISPEVDLSNPASYRDLSKPVGALNADRLAKLKDRYDEMPEPKFLYGSHYSTPGFVLYYLVRKMPQYMLCLQNGRFDNPDRMFNSIPDTWRNVTTNTSDFKELIPQFYEPENKGEFLLNCQNLDFGHRQDGTKVGNVELPLWAKDPQDFISILREALESDYVSVNIHQWIDLIFGYKQTGEEAMKADNVFYHLTYEGAIDLDNIRDLNERYSLEVQIMEFGQTPKQIFSCPHPQRKFPMPIQDGYFLDISLESSASGEYTEDILTTDKSKPRRKTSSIYVDCWKRNMATLKIITEYKLHKEEVTGVSISSDGKSVFSVSQDSLLKMYSLEDKRQLRSINISNMALSSCFLMNDDKTMITSSWDNYVYTYNIAYGKVVDSRMAHDDAVTDISWNDGILATASWDSTAKIWQYDEHCLRPYAAAGLMAELDHETGVSCIDLSKDNSLLVSGTSEGHITFWSLKSFTLIAQHGTHVGMVYAVAFSPDSEKVASCGKDHMLKVLDVKTGTQLFSKDVGEELRCLCWDGISILIGSERGNILVWDLITVKQLNSVPGHTGSVTCLAVSKDGSIVVSGGEDKKVIVWNSAPL